MCHAASGVALPAPGRRRSRYTATPTPPAAIAPLKPATNDVHPVRNAARLAERFAQVDVLAAGFRLPRRQFGVRQRAEERERAAEHPHAENRRAIRQQGRDKAGRDEDADADDVGDDDGGGVERAEASLERSASRADHRLSC